MKSLAASVFIFLLCFPARTQAVETDTSSVHPFNKAVLFSAILPGGGQVYNSIIKKKGFRHAIWKVPLIYAGLGATIYTLIENQNTQQSLRAEYTSRLDGIARMDKSLWSKYWR